MERGFNYSVPIKNLVAQEFLLSHIMGIMIQTTYRWFTEVTDDKDNTGFCISCYDDKAEEGYWMGSSWKQMDPGNAKMHLLSSVCLPSSSELQCQNSWGKVWDFEIPLDYQGVKNEALNVNTCLIYSFGLLLSCDRNPSLCQKGSMSKSNHRTIIQLFMLLFV